MKMKFLALLATGFVLAVCSCGNESQNSNSGTDTAYNNSANSSTNSNVNNSLDTNRINDTLRRDTSGRDTMRQSR